MKKVIVVTFQSKCNPRVLKMLACWYLNTENIDNLRRFLIFEYRYSSSPYPRWSAPVFWRVHNLKLNTLHSAAAPWVATKVPATTPANCQHSRLRGIAHFGRTAWHLLAFGAYWLSEKLRTLVRYRGTRTSVWVYHIAHVNSGLSEWQGIGILDIGIAYFQIGQRAYFLHLISVALSFGFFFNITMLGPTPRMWLTNVKI